MFEKVLVPTDFSEAAEDAVSLAEKQDASLIIMSSQGKSWLKQVRVGSTTFDVARKAECPVLVVKSGQPKASKS